MATAKLFRKLQPFQLHIILGLTIVFFITELIVSHVTHALVLLMDSYHMLCNIMALTGCIITMKYDTISESQDPLKKSLSQSKASSVGEEITSKKTNCVDKKNDAKTSPTQETQLKKLKNTFGWARIDVVSTLMCCVFLASFSFSIFVEALQTLVHIDHQDEMHYPITVFCIGSIGLLLNGVCYLLIGGYTFHQGSFLYITESGDVVLSKVVVNKSVEHGEKRLSRTKVIHNTTKPPKQRQGLWEMMRDINGCIIVIICAALIYFTNKDTAKYIDPVLSLVSAAVIMVLSYPYMIESCLILLQTIPDTINIEALKAELVNHFPDVINVHDFHIWQLTASKIFSTVHIIFENPKVYSKIKDDVKEFFIENGISHVTIQPEFCNKNTSMESILNKVLANCLFSCQEEGCKASHCCPKYARDEELLNASRECLSRSQEIQSDNIVKTIEDQTISSNGQKANVNEQLRNQRNLEKNECTKCETFNSEAIIVSSKENINSDNRNDEDHEENVNPEVISQKVSTIEKQNEDTSERDRSSSDKPVQTNEETDVQETFKKSDAENDNNSQES